MRRAKVASGSALPLLDALGGQDAADLRGLPGAVPVEDRVQVVQVRRAAVARQFALERGLRGVCVAGLADSAADRGDGRHWFSSPFTSSVRYPATMRPMTY